MGHEAISLPVDKDSITARLDAKYMAMRPDLAEQRRTNLREGTWMAVLAVLTALGIRACVNMTPSDRQEEMRESAGAVVSEDR